MTHILSLGAINKITGEYVYPKIANKKDTYMCPECNKDLILVQGKIRVHHFRHKIDSIRPCKYYSKPTESQIHKDAKMLMKTLLEKNTPIQFMRECVSCKLNTIIDLPATTAHSSIKLEHRFDYNDEIKIADVAHIIDSEIKCIYEICHTHKTLSKNRPEPWVEINAKSLLMAADNNTFPLIINCVRCEKCEECNSEVVRNLAVAKELFIGWFNHFRKSILTQIDDQFDNRLEECKFTINDGIVMVEYDLGRLFSQNYTADMVIDYKGQDTYYIDITRKIYSDDFIQDCIEYGIDVYYIDFNWILQQLHHDTMPSKIEVVKIINDNKKLHLEMVQNVKKAIHLFKSWIIAQERRGSNIEPFICRDFDAVFSPNFDHEWSEWIHWPDNIPDIIIIDKSNDRYHIDLIPKTYSDEYYNILNEYSIGLYYVDYNWILQQSSDIIPSRIKCLKIRDPYSSDVACNVKSISKPLPWEIDIYKYVYLKVDFSKKDMIKEYGGKWNACAKVWYVTLSTYNKYIVYISEIGEKINWTRNGKPIVMSY